VLIPLKWGQNNIQTLMPSLKTDKIQSILDIYGDVSLTTKIEGSSVELVTKTVYDRNFSFNATLEVTSTINDTTWPLYRKYNGSSHTFTIVNDYPV
jgi:hypothetical protein